jgi:glycosyltransferase involved in cell wall biosynthesis
MSLNKNKKYSILIPTKNGGKYIGHAIESVLQQKYLNFELIVSNNHSTDETGAYLSSIVDDRLTVISPKEPLSMSEHYEFMLAHARGEWITIIGDDDALMPYFFEYLEKLTEKYNNIEVVSSARAYYFWQDNIYSNKNIVVSYKSSPLQTLRQTRFDLLLALIGVKSCFDLPQLYTTSVIRKDLIQLIKERQGGNFYQSIIPDMYSAVALALNCENYLRVETPLFWVGTSSKSMGISTRIYDDSVKKDGETKRSLKLNSTIPQEIHSAGFGSMYLYEGLLQYPADQKYFTQKLVIIFIMGDILKQIHKNKYNINISQKDLMKSYKKYLEEINLNFYLELFVSKLLSILNLYFLSKKAITFLKIYVLAKLKFKGYAYFLSKDRADLDNIGIASKEIEGGSNNPLRYYKNRC